MSLPPWGRRAMELWQGFKFREEKYLDPSEKQGIPGISDFSEFFIIFSNF
jgi:hypothetical protein